MGIPGANRLRVSRRQDPAGRVLPRRTCHVFRVSSHNGNFCHSICWCDRHYSWYNISYHWYHWYHPVTIGLHRITYLQLALNWLHSWNMHEWTPNEMTEPEASGAKRGSSNSGCGPLATWNSVDDSTNKIGPKTIHFEYVDFNNVGRADIQMIQYLYLFRNWVRSPIGIAARWYSINHLRWLPSGYD